MKQFRVLFVDDKIGETIPLGSEIVEAFKKDTNEKPGWILDQLRQVQPANDRHLHLYFATDLLFRPQILEAEPSVRSFGENTPPWQDSFLQELDVLILDFGEIQLSEDFFLNEEDELETKDGKFIKLNKKEIEELNSKYSGAAFYLKNREKLKHTQKVIFYTQYNPLTYGSSIKVIEKYIRPLCNGEAQPFTIFKTPSIDNESIVGDIKLEFDTFSKKFTRLENGLAVQFAARHDLPVIIVGETGTGKEGIAHRIHHAWVKAKREKEKRSKEENLTVINENLTVINCAGLSRELARNELFGHVKGAYTGADDHSIGAILSACGCEGFKAIKPVQETNKYKPQFDLLEDLAKKLTILIDIKDQEKKIAYLSSHVLPAINDAIVPYSKNHNRDDSAFYFFKNLHKLYNNAIRGTDFVADFERGLVAANNKLLLEEDAQPIKFKEKGPFGTLFLDEFADLPLEVQTLLLRYLESKELQPVGYPRVIKGANVRIIVATSDPRIAAFVNKDLKWSWRSKHERDSRPFREDLIFRVKGQVIQAEAVTPDNAAEIVEHLIKHSTKADKWTPDAQKLLTKLIVDHLIEIEEISKTVTPNNNLLLPTFGHKREIITAIKLANEYATAKCEIGIPGSNEITEDVINFVWQPSRVRFDRIADSSDQETKFENAQSKINSADITSNLNPKLASKIEKLHQQLKQFFESVNEPFPDDWKDKSPLFRGDFIKNWLKRMVSENRSDEINHCRIQSQKFSKEVIDMVFAEKPNTFSGWFRVALKELKVWDSIVGEEKSKQKKKS